MTTRGALVLPLIFLVLTGFAPSVTAAEAPYLSGRVVDEMHLLSDRDHTEIEQSLADLEQKTQAQMAVLITQSLQDLDIESYSIMVAEKWQLGKKGQDRGLIMVIAPKEKKMRIEVGYGLEGDITDAFSRRVIEEDLKPYFRNAQFGAGIKSAIHSIGTKLGADVAVGVEEAPRSQRKGKTSWIFNILFILFFFVIWIFQFIRRLLFPFSPSYRRGSSYWGGGGFGGGGFGGGSSGGFGGGGGSFGGGGSSGSW